MALDKFLDYLAYGEPHPNDFTRYLGEQIKKAREESKMSQKELAGLIHKRQATVSDIENGKGEVDTSTLALLAHVLNKPFGYFYPWFLYKEIKQESLTPLENELIIQFRKIWDDTLRKLVIDQVRIVGEYNPKDLVANSVEEIKTLVEEEISLEQILNRRGKKQRKR
jgi:transcriptional regulator with XRE-family HTH domain